MDRAIDMFNYEEVSPKDLAEKIFEFSGEELDLLEIFWLPAFNNSWIILRRELIKEWFCGDERDKDSVNNFYRRMLMKKFVEGVDYEEISQEEYTGIDSTNLSNQKLHPKANRARVYKVTGKCFKKIGMMKNDKITDYFLKVEEMAQFMYRYISECSKHREREAVENSTKAIEQANKDKEKAEHRAIVFEKAIKNKMIKLRDEWIYIATTPTYAKSGWFKIGATKNNIHKRLKKYQTGRAPGDKMYMCWKTEVHDSLKMDDIIKNLLADFRNDATEMYHFVYDDLIDIVDSIIDNHGKNVEIVNEYKKYKMRDALLQLENPQPIPPDLMIEEKTRNVLVDIVSHAKDVLDLTNMTTEEKRKALLDRLNHLSTENETVTKKLFLQPYVKKGETWFAFKNFFGWVNSKTPIHNGLTITYK